VWVWLPAAIVAASAWLLTRRGGAERYVERGGAR
jgi:hypothetical protein